MISCETSRKPITLARDAVYSLREHTKVLQRDRKQFYDTRPNTRTVHAEITSHEYELQRITTDIRTVRERIDNVESCVFQKSANPPRYEVITTEERPDVETHLRNMLEELTETENRLRQGLFNLQFPPEVVRIDKQIAEAQRQLNILLPLVHTH